MAKIDRLEIEIGFKNYDEIILKLEHIKELLEYIYKIDTINILSENDINNILEGTKNNIFIDEKGLFNGYGHLRYASDEELNKEIKQCPNCHAGILDNGKCANNYTNCSIEINKLKEVIEKIKKFRGIIGE